MKSSGRTLSKALEEARKTLEALEQQVQVPLVALGRLLHGGAAPVARW